MHQLLKNYHYMVSCARVFTYNSRNKGWASRERINSKNQEDSFFEQNFHVHIATPHKGGQWVSKVYLQTRQGVSHGKSSIDWWAFIDKFWKPNSTIQSLNVNSNLVLVFFFPNERNTEIQPVRFSIVCGISAYHCLFLSDDLLGVVHWSDGEKKMRTDV